MKERRKMKCKTCDRGAIKNGYCQSHAKAYENIIEKYDVWKKALGISWKEYLSEIAKNSLTGEWATQVAQQLIENGENSNVENS